MSGNLDNKFGITQYHLGIQSAELEAAEKVEQRHRREMLAQPPILLEQFTVKNVADSVRQFESGATRSSDSGRYDPEGFLSPIVIERFCEYMNKNRRQPDGSIRASDNWQKGIPKETYMKGLWRHFLHAWTRFRGFKVMDPMASADLEEDMCAIIFGASGMLFEILKEKQSLVNVAKQTI